MAASKRCHATPRQNAFSCHAKDAAINFLRIVALSFAILTITRRHLRQLGEEAMDAFYHAMKRTWKAFLCILRDYIRMEEIVLFR